MVRCVHRPIARGTPLVPAVALPPFRHACSTSHPCTALTSVPVCDLLTRADQGVTAWMQRPVQRGRPNERFLQHTLRRWGWLSTCTMLSAVNWTAAECVALHGAARCQRLAYASAVRRCIEQSNSAACKLTASLPPSLPHHYAA